MHLPDGFLTPEVWVPLWALAAAVLAFSVWRVNRRLEDRHVPLLGVLAAFVFAVQMLNVPVAGGTSGHVVGGVLIAVFVGPLAGSLVMASILAVQALFFQDGGITTLGANILNMGLIGAILGYWLYFLISRVVGGKRGRMVGAGVAAWVAIVLASVACSLELAASGTSPLSVALPAMVGYHAVIGVVEAVVTVAVVGMVSRARPDLLELPKL
ncbi:MAG: cobalamin biosynthesis protein CbiM [Hadesarchaea archaeon]|jgi:cobalt/nickel transport system permease protein|nr:MAG: cobalamin biosynthesis protein CbiM [Hadesarchaea archaeon]